jgi:hypothetical protein
MMDTERQIEEPSVTAGGDESGGNYFCTQDCVWMGPEIDRLKKENLGLRDLVKRLADKLESESERPYRVESLIKEARELKDIDKKDCDAFCPRVATLEEMLAQQTKTCDELRKENTALLARLKLTEIKPVIVTNSVSD